MGYAPESSLPFTTVINNPITKCPRDGNWYEVLLFGKVKEKLIKFDAEFGKDGAWFDDKNCMIAEKDIFQWRRYYC